MTERNREEGRRRRKAKPKIQRVGNLKLSRLRQDRKWKLEIEGKVKSKDKIERENTKGKRENGVSLPSIILLSLYILYYCVWTFLNCDFEQQTLKFSFLFSSFPLLRKKTREKKRVTEARGS